MYLSIHIFSLDSQLGSQYFSSFCRVYEFQFQQQAHFLCTYSFIYIFM